jgi:HKD family nuclease
MKLYSNSNETRLENRLNEICKDTDLYISVAFFWHSDFIFKSLENGCNIMLIVRLDFGTSPDELLKIINSNNPNINIRYYSCKTFHPKLYIIDNTCAIIGSSNLTHKGLYNNLELNIEIEKDNPIFGDIKSEFYYEWENAGVLTKEKALEFKEIYDQNKNRLLDSQRLFFLKMGEVLTPNITNDNKKNISKEIIENFRRKYQLYISAVNKLINIYTSVSDKRKYSEKIPLRMEIDRFLSWIKDSQYIGEAYKDRPILNEKEIIAEIVSLKNEFINFKGNEYYNNTERNFLKLNENLGSEEKIKTQPINNLVESLKLINAFHDQLRFYEGGLEFMVKEFLTKNDHDKIRNTLIYILFGKGDYVTRIFNSLYDPKYKLQAFGENSIKELFGNINNENIPTCNGRMQRSMQWLGFGNL